MSSVTFYKICELLLVVIYAFGADYMMTSVLGRRFVPKRKIPFFNFQRLAYILTLVTTFLFLSHENTAYTTVYKLVVQFAIVIFMYKGKFALRVLMGAAHFFTLFIGEFLSLNAIYALGIPIERLYVKFSFWVLMCDLLSSLLVFIVGFVAHRIREFPTKSLSSKQLQKLSALPIAAGAAVIVFCLLEYSFISPIAGRLCFACAHCIACGRNHVPIGYFFGDAENAAACKSSSGIRAGSAVRT